MELIVCLSIFCVVAFYVSPFSAMFSKKDQLSIITNDIKSAIKFSRLEAMIRQERLILSSLNENDWSQGMKLYYVNNRLKKTQDETVIREWRWSCYDMLIVWSGFQSKTSLIFMPDLKKSAINGTFVISSPNLRITSLVINRLGRISTIAG